MRIDNPEIRILAGISQALEADYKSETDTWAGSPFAWIKTRPSRAIGAIGEKLVAGWLAARGFNIARSPDSDADRIVENSRVEIKFSTLWENGCYTFQQLRDQNYDIVICLGVSPFDAHCWVIPKVDIMKLWKIDHQISSQHGGASGSDTAWLQVRPDAVPEWISSYGGNLSSAIKILGKYVGFEIPPLGNEID